MAGVTVLILHHVDQLHFYRYYLQFKHLRKTFKHRFCLPALSGDFIEKPGGSGTNDCQQLSREEMDEDPIIQKYAEKGCSLSSYILTGEEMRLHDYPVKGCDDYSHFVQTDCNGLVTDSSPLFGLDCEMCLTDKGSELTRIAVVDTSGRCLMNELVKPKWPIRNYLTWKEIQSKAQLGHDPTEDAQCALELAQYFIEQGARKPHLCIQYEVLEGAQLALEELNGAEIGRSALQIQRPVTETTLEGEVLVQELERDPENEGMVYLAGLRKGQDEKELQEQLGPLKGLRSIFWPRGLQTERRRNYCFLRFQSPECASEALRLLQGSMFRSRRALSSPTFFQWARLVNEKGQGGAEGQEKQQQVLDLVSKPRLHGVPEAE
ncbi:hypothetical protein Chor_015216 [Crotalus horridus]